MAHAIGVDKLGGPEVLQWEGVPVREPRPGEVRLRHSAIGLNYVEVVQRNGGFPFRLPFTPGNEGAVVLGTVSSEAKAVLAQENGCEHPIL